MLNKEQLSDLLNDGVVLDESGNKVGKVGQVYLDDQSGDPEWVTASTGFFGTSETFIPVQEASATGNEIRVPYSKDMIKDAPRMDDAEGHLSPDQEQELYRYYGIASGQASRSGGVDSDFGQEHHGVPEDETRGDPEAMVRSEEQLRVGTEKVSTGTARLRKYVVTENVTKTVPVEREVVRLEREPITGQDGDHVNVDGDLGDDEQEITISEERVVVNKETVPVERVSLDTETVTEEQQVTEQVRKEQIDTDLPEDNTARS